MWTFLYALASPKAFFQKSQRLLPYLRFFAVVFLLIGLFSGLFIAPADYQQGDAFRILYVHVPAAFLSLSLYGFMAFLALLFLIWRIKLAGILIVPTAKVGVLMAFLALMTGAIWGKPMWGTWWVWDARLTSEFILLLLYAAILATAAAFHNKTQGEKLVAILVLVGVVDLPIIHYSVYWWNTLHQGATLSLFEKPKIAPAMLYPLLVTLVGFAFYVLWVIIAQSLPRILVRERHQRWVRQWFEEKGQRC